MENLGLSNDELQDAIRETTIMAAEDYLTPQVREQLHEHLRDLLRVQLHRATFIPMQKDHAEQMAPDMEKDPYSALAAISAIVKGGAL